MKKILLIVVFCIVLCGCGKDKSFNLKDIIEENNYIIIDVRTKEEYEDSHIKDAINIPYDELTDSIDKSKKILVYCRSGSRSKTAFDILKKLGYEVYDLGSIDNIELPREN